MNLRIYFKSDSRRGNALLVGVLEIVLERGVLRGTLLAMTRLSVIYKRCGTCVLTAFVGCFSSILFGGFVKASSEVEITAFNERLTQAYENEDIEVLEALLADDHVHNNIFGMSMSKAQLLEDIRLGVLAFEYYRTPEIRFVFQGDDVCIATGVIEAKAERSGQDVGALKFRFTRVFVKRDGRWQSLLFQNTRVVPPPVKKPIEDVA
ncbi:MAG: hypothetical protein Tsb0018_04240 [Opitutales bacterium]|tara:strand:+ start:1008 stop:1628 length:621 start_codon:yes stop_codon:yes gene_type:complete